MGRVSVVFSAGVAIRAIDLSGDDMAMESVTNLGNLEWLRSRKASKKRGGFCLL